MSSHSFLADDLEQVPSPQSSDFNFHDPYWVEMADENTESADNDNHQSIEEEHQLTAAANDDEDGGHDVLLEDGEIEVRGNEGAQEVNVDNDNHGLQQDVCGEGPHKDFHQSPGPNVNHSVPLNLCHNDNHHQICKSCETKMDLYLRTYKKELFTDTMWPLCDSCGNRAVKDLFDERTAAHGPQPFIIFTLNGCSCTKDLLCYDCRLEERNMTRLKNALEAEERRKECLVDENGVPATPDEIKRGTGVFVTHNFLCECGADLDFRKEGLLKCAGCGGLTWGEWNEEMAVAKASDFAKYHCRQA